MGVLRTVLALMVVVHHLFIVSPMGGYAVFGFYIISGYLMTLIMHESYGYTLQGRLRFGLNRFLRLYPQYWLAMLFSLLLIAYMGQTVVLRYHPKIFIPYSWETWFQNLTMLFIAWNPMDVSPRLIPLTWTITVEICFYLLICLGVSKTLNRSLVWFAFSLLYVLVAAYYGWSMFVSLPAASLPFSVGALIYFLPKVKFPAKVLFALLILNLIVWWVDYSIIGRYLNIAICGLLVSSLAGGQKLFFSNDKAIGDYSYPIYLLHWQVGLLMSYLLFGHGIHEFSLRGFINLVISLVFLYGLSSLFIKYIDKPINRIRDRVKHADKRRIDCSPTETTGIRCSV